MNFKERLKLVNSILIDCPYDTQKEEIIELFEKTKNNVRKDILCRLATIDGYYSTNMNRRLFGFEELADLILDLEKNNKLKNINVTNFINDNLTKNGLLRSIGIDKKGEPGGHAFSLITKYIYFRTKFNFPIYDRLVFKGLKEEDLITGTQAPKLNYFLPLVKIKAEYNISFDELDKYYWICGKVREGSLSLLISDSKSYVNDYLKKLNLNKTERALNSVEFSNMLAKKLVSEKEWFDNPKLKQIQKLARSIKNERVFKNLKSK